MKFSMIPFLCVLLMAGTGSYAKEQVKVPVIKKTSAPISAQTIVGKTLAVTYADTGKGTKSEIVVAAVTGSDVHVIILDTTTMYDEKGQSITRDNIPIGRTVKVKYTANKAGIFEARSIRLMIQ